MTKPKEALCDRIVFRSVFRFEPALSIRHNKLYINVYRQFEIYLDNLRQTLLDSSLTFVQVKKHPESL